MTRDVLGEGREGRGGEEREKGKEEREGEKGINKNRKKSSVRTRGPE